MFQPGDKVKVVKINSVPGRYDTLSALVGQTGFISHSLGHDKNTIYAVQIDGQERHFWLSELEPVPKTKLAVIAIKDNLILSTNVFDDEKKAENHFFQKCEAANPNAWKRYDENEKERLALLARRYKRPYQTHADGQFGGLSCIDVYLTDINE